MYFGILERELISAALAEYHVKLSRVGNRPRAAICLKMQDKLERAFRILNDIEILSQ